MAKTRKQKRGVMTIPQLRKAFEHMESFTVNLLKKTKDSVGRRKAFQKEWQKVFHRSVDDKAADAYLHFEAKKHGKEKSSTRKQRGGAVLEGAPLDYSTRPGIYGVHGEFPAYVTSGFDIYDKINMDSPRIGCGVENITPKIPAGLGSNEVNFQNGGKRRKRSTRRRGRRHAGGGFLDYFMPSSIESGAMKLGNTMNNFAAALSQRPMTASVPTSAMYDAQSAWKGQALPPTPSANTANPPYISAGPRTLEAVATGIQRDLGGEIRS